MTFDLSSIGWDESFATAYRHYARPDRRPARVTRVDRGVCTVLAGDGAHRASIGGGLLASAATDPTRLPCTGDWVVLRFWPDERTTIEAVLSRRSAIVRASAGAQAVAQVLAANLDSVAVVESIHPEPDLARIERMLSLAWESGAAPLVVLTKADLAPNPQVIADQVAEVTLGVNVYPVSATHRTGLRRLRPLVAHGRTLGLLGPSGSGKSTLVNALAGAAVMGVQAIRRGDGRGRHTTTFRALVPLPGAGAVLDTPGIRAVGLFDGVQGFDQAFADIRDIAARCRFVDCGHDSEPGCAVAEALATGELSQRRMRSWLKLRTEIAYETHRRDVRAAAHVGRPVVARVRGRSRYR